MKSLSSQRLQVLHGVCQAETRRVLAWRLHQAATLLEMRRDGLAGYFPDSSLLGPSLRDLQAEVNELGHEHLDLRVLKPLELCARSRELGNDSAHLDLTIAACLFRSGAVQEGRDMYVQALLRATCRAMRARCLTSIAAIHFVEGDLLAAASFSRAAMTEDSGLQLVHSNAQEIEAILQETGY